FVQPYVCTPYFHHKFLPFISGGHTATSISIVSQPPCKISPGMRFSAVFSHFPRFAHAQFAIV
uniref:hypothetical protein n=1 Tax=Gemmiger formicilis TaxID=745368 RepID=UPI003FF0E59A